MRETLAQTSKGDFKIAIDRIEKLHLKSNDSIKVIISCCTICSKRPGNLNAQDLCRLLKLCIDNIQFENVDQNLMNDFVPAMYHIIKYLLIKDHAAIIDLREVILPKFITKNLKDKQIKYYLSISNLIYSAVVDYTNSKTELTLSEVLKLCQLTLKIIAVVSSQETILEWFYKYLIVFNAIKLNCDELEVQFKFLSILTEENAKKGSNKTDIFSISAKILKLTIIVYRQRGSILKVRDSIDLFFKITNMCNAEDCGLFKIIKNTVSLLSDIEEYPGPQELNNLLITVYEELKTAQKTYEYSEKLLSVCDTVDVIFLNLYHYYKDISPESWKKKFTKETATSLFKIFTRISYFLSNIKITCIKCENCSANAGLSRAVFFMCLGFNIFKLSLTNKMKYSKILLKELLVQFEQICKHVRYLKLQNCSSWQTAWIESGTAIFNIGINLFTLEDEECINFFNSFIENLVEFEGTENSSIRANILDSSLAALTGIHWKKRNYKDTMMLSAIRIILSDNDRDTIFLQWIRAKAASGDENDGDKELTLISILQEDLRLQKTFANLRFDNADLLIYELEQYKLKWASKLPMMSAFRELLKNASTVTCAKVFVKIWGLVTSNVHEEVPNLLEKLLNKLENELQTKESKLLIGCLSFCRYKYQMASLIKENVAQMERMATSSSEPVDDLENASHPNDECDVVIRQENLTCLSIIKSNKHLIKALNLIGKHVTDGCDLELIKEINLLEIVFKIGYEFRLHLNSHYFIVTWMLALKIARLLNDNLVVLKCISFLLEKIDINSEKGQEYVQLASTIIVFILEDDDINSLKILTHFYINKSLAYLHSLNIDKCVVTFNKAEKYFKLLPDSPEHITLKVKLKYLHFKLVMLPCNLHVVNHQEETLIKIHQAYHLIVDHLKREGTNCAYFFSILFDVMEAINHLYRWLRMPREMRCYGREILHLAQRLLVSLRAAQFMVYLAHADLQTLRFNDCQVKMEGISNILYFPNQKTTHLQVPLKFYTNEKKDTDVETVAFELQEMTLDVPAISNSPGSPIMKRNSFALPEFLHHKIECKCYFCSCIEYQEAILMKMHLDALVNVFNNQSKSVCGEFFSGALRYFDSIIAKSGNPQSTTLQFLRHVNWAFYETYSMTLLDYGNYKIRFYGKESVAETNKELISLVSERKFQNLYLFNEALEQRINLLNDFKYQIQDITSKSSEETAEACVLYNKTPESKISKFVLNKSCSPSSPIMPKRRVKGVQLEFSDEEADSTENTEKESKKTFKTPFNNNKIKIYTPAPVKSTKKDQLSPVSQRANKNILKSEGEVPNFVRPAETPLASNKNKENVKLESGLRSKTKLLTERVKNSTKKDLPLVIVTDESNPLTENKPLRSGVRKNLLEELDVASEKPVRRTRKVQSKTEEVTKTCVRKSSRTKK